MTLQPAIFLDRDGVIIENRANYVRSWGDVEIYSQALETLARFRDCGYKIVIVTNQSAVGRGIISRETAEGINDRLVATIERVGGRVDRVYMCPHAPADDCSCRKPEPGMLRQAAVELDIDLSRSIMIGDALSDVGAGHAAGVQQSVLLLTGRGAEQARLTEAETMEPYSIYASLTEALDSLLADGQ